MGGKYIPSTNELLEQYNKYRKLYNYKELPDFSHDLAIYEAKMWNDWIENGGDPGDQLDLLYIDGMTLRFWITKYKELREKGQNQNGK